MTEARLKQPLYLQPILMDRVWGGNRLPTLFGRPATPDKVIGESWELADRPEAQSAVVDSATPGVTVRQLLEQYPEQILGQALAARRPARFPLLVKYIDAGQTLSVQVHPDDQGAAAHHDRGKAECWVVVHAEPGARIIRGLKPGTTRAQLEQELTKGKVEDVLHVFEPHVGDVVALPPGMVHALGAGLIVAEVQQNSDLTFRLYDHNRVDRNGNGRKLHIAEALDAIRFDGSGSEFPGNVAADTWTPLYRRRRAGVTVEHILQGQYFDLFRYRLAPGARMALEALPTAPRVLMAIAGVGRLGRQVIKGGQTVLLPAAARAMAVSARKGASGELILLATSPTLAAC